MTDDRSVRRSFVRRNLKFVAGSAAVAMLALSAPSMASAAHSGGTLRASSVGKLATIYVEEGRRDQGQAVLRRYDLHAVQQRRRGRLEPLAALLDERCDRPLQPCSAQHARLVQAHWAIQDSDAGADLSCEVWRTKSTGTGIGGETKLADAVSAGAPGAARINSPVTHGVINNDSSVTSPSAGSPRPATSASGAEARLLHPGGRQDAPRPEGRGDTETGWSSAQRPLIGH